MGRHPPCVQGRSKVQHVSFPLSPRVCVQPPSSANTVLLALPACWGPACSYDYFQPQGLTPEQQQLFRYIEDADLWRWQLPESKAFTAGGQGEAPDAADMRCVCVCVCVWR